MMNKYQPKDKEWFLARIGKKVYRDYRKCCGHCDDVAKNGLKVMDEQHVEYLVMNDLDFAIDGVYLNYRDNKTKSPTPCKK
jgi:hypothetical protein